MAIRRARPRRGERYRLSALADWPGKKEGDHPPVIEILSNWKKGSGRAKLTGNWQTLFLHHYDLGDRL